MSEPRNKPKQPSVAYTVVVINGVGVAVPKGSESLFLDVYREAAK